MLLYAVIKTPYADDFQGLHLTNASVNILDIRVDKNGIKTLLEIRGDEEVANTICEEPVKISRYKFICTIYAKSPLLNVISQYIIMNGAFSSEGIIWTLILNNYVELRSLLNSLLSTTRDVKVLKIVKAERKDPITARQEQILKVALEAGFFDYPRRIGLKELAKKLNMSPSSLSEIIRRAEKNIIVEYFKNREL
ncbi:bacterio-opsin activator [Sulfolobus sp. A20]|uniref:helix-turn-helix domain-containing protein n=1 Tax=Saccharolobus sp. A20 TaxID=1891280 RepID=UPI000845C206|nr:helix-turn-helix domain-containing protein [Sulfolobus sp. A20]TRM75026.1 bacterio-opsin activator [Sulfolobus sp. E5]TRM78519.1 bacterio-opsin activator [Sulfolobus sp. A20-N-F8]TRM82340.1 bacterio-opsin activator [Sulfolobus sp. D5]TRM89849.1 bacterio-opsin activator [Sulfolobus sp. C3]TRM95366.1 bacterio-opsin activator [Sulfolobus sp. A20-N-G8]TRM96636.1 bacterio-opsin activator [Sulfolobus sp. F1]TRN03042.1 bacterio-opsin activator [Sulfolobus sp. E1]